MKKTYGQVSTAAAFGEILNMLRVVVAQLKVDLMPIEADALVMSHDISCERHAGHQVLAVRWRRPKL